MFNLLFQMIAELNFENLYNLAISDCRLLHTGRSSIDEMKILKFSSLVSLQSHMSPKLIFEDLCQWTSPQFLARDINRG